MKKVVEGQQRKRLLVLICSGPVPKWEEEEGYWTEVGQKIEIEERLQPGRCLRRQGKRATAAVSPPREGTTAIVP